MARVKKALVKSRKHKKILKEAKGYYGHKSTGFKSAKEQVRKSREYAFRDRKQLKREMRKIWIIRISAATKEYDLTYSVFINKMEKNKIVINRKMLSDIAINDKLTFKKLIDIAKK